MRRCAAPWLPPCRRLPWAGHQRTGNWVAFRPRPAPVCCSLRHRAWKWWLSRQGWGHAKAVASAASGVASCRAPCLACMHAQPVVELEAPGQRWTSHCVCGIATGGLVPGVARVVVVVAARHRMVAVARVGQGQPQAWAVPAVQPPPRRVFLGPASMVPQWAVRARVRVQVRCVASRLSGRGRRLCQRTAPQGRSHRTVTA